MRFPLVLLSSTLHRVLCSPSIPPNQHHDDDDDHTQSSYISVPDEDGAQGYGYLEEPDDDQYDVIPPVEKDATARGNLILLDPTGEMENLDDDTPVNENDATSMFSFQNIGTSDNYAGSASYDPLSDTIYLTGSTYGPLQGKNDTSPVSSCFLLSVSGKSSAILSSELFSSTDANAGCRAMVHYREKSSEEPILFSTGHFEKSRLLMDSTGEVVAEHTSTETLTSTGFALGKPTQPKMSQIGNERVTSFVISEAQIQYPVAIALEENADLEFSHHVVIASLFTDKEDINLDFPTQEETTSEGRGRDPSTYKYGTDFGIHIQRLQYLPDENSFRGSWTRTYGTKDNREARVSDVISMNGKIVFIGTTSGHGSVFGSQEAQFGSKFNNDGFVTKLNTETGVVPVDEANSVRIASEGEEDDILEGACFSPRRGAESFFVVGSTTGVMDQTFEQYYTLDRHDYFYAFLTKMDLETLEVVWTKQLGTIGRNTDVLGVGCAVTDDDETVYMTGIVTNGGKVVDDAEGDGEDDNFFVSSFSTEGGKQNWVKQVGSGRNDVLGKGSGSIFVDNDGHATVFGTTRGRLYQDTKLPTEDDADIFLLKFERGTGNHAPILPHRMITSDPGLVIDPMASFLNKVAIITHVAILILLVLSIAAVGMRFVWGQKIPKNEILQDTELAQGGGDDYDEGYDFEHSRGKNPSDVFDYGDEMMDDYNLGEDVVVDESELDTSDATTYDELLNSLGNIETNDNKVSENGQFNYDDDNSSIGSKEII